MEVSEKIIRYSSFDNLIDAIKNDINTRDFLSQRYGVRFIMLNSFDTLRKLVFEMLDMGVELVRLDSILPKDEPDSWITTDQLKESILSCTKPSLITPFSELVRFYPEEQFRGFFNEIILSERIKSNRIYIPLIGLENRFIDFLSHFGRLSESAPIWQFNDPAPQSVEVFVIQKFKDINPTLIGKRCYLRTLSEWLEFWKDAPKERIVCSSLPINVNRKYSRPDNIFKFTPITNSYDYITQFLDVNLGFPYEEAEEDYLRLLLKDIVSLAKESFDFWEYVRDHFNVKQLSMYTLLDIWGRNNSTSYERWLVKKYFEHIPEANDFRYLLSCLQETTELSSSSELFRKIAQNIFYMPKEENVQKFIQEREKILQSLSSTFLSLVPDSIQEWMFDHIKEIGKNNVEIAVSLCSGIFDYEKQYLMGVLATHFDEEISKIVLSKYEDLRDYLSEDDISLTTDEWVLDYISKYKRAKIKDSLTEELKALVSEKNANKNAFYNWYYSFKNSKERLSEVLKSSLKPNKVYWLDGLGIEYISLIRKIVSSNPSFHVATSEITRANLPSETKLNGFYDEGIIKYEGLDKLGHDSAQYRPFETLGKEIELVKSYLNTILSDNSGSPVTITIVSDHGMSALSRKADSRKLEGKYNHEGRFMLVDKNGFADDDYFFTHKNEDDGKLYRVALTHSSLATKPTHEVHGGATPEEVLVPFIVITNKQDDKKVNYNINTISDKIPISKPRVELIINPQPQSVTLSYKGKTVKMERVGTQWGAIVEGVKEGKMKCFITPDFGDTQDIEIEFYGFGMGNIDEEFDI